MLKLITGIMACYWGMQNAEAGETQWLKSQLRSLTSEQSLIRSYTDSEQAYLYDQALAVMAFSHAGEHSHAKKLALAMKQLQNSDGTWYFSYYLNGKSPHPAEGDMRPNGAIAWSALALITYERLSKDQQLRTTWQKTLEHLERHIVPIPKLAVEGLQFSAVDNPKTHWDERQVAALEHALDALAAFRNAYLLTGEPRWLKNQIKLEAFALRLWDEETGHFWSGVNVSSGKINRDEFYLDNQSWSALAMEHLPLKTQLQSALRSSCELQVKSGRHLGFTESRSPAGKGEFIWSEGTAGKALALELQGIQCEATATDSYAKTLEHMKVAGGVRYVDRPQITNFSHSPSVAGTVWTWFLKFKINPLG